MKTFLRISISLLVPMLLVWTTPAQAQWRTQSIQLQPGWNAVHLEVQPEPEVCDQVFAGKPVESVWKWNRRFTSVQFTVDPQTLVEEDPDWLVWLQPTNPKAFLSRLLFLQGNQSYLIKVDTNASPFTLNLKGRVIIPRLQWYPHSLNLVGFPVNPANPPTFSDFFKFTTEVDTSLGYQNELYRLDPLGRGVRIVQPNRDRVQPGVAYWVACNRKPAHMSALDVIAVGGEIDFGALLSEKELRIRNAHPSATLTAWLQQRASETPPSTGLYPELAGPVPLSYLSRNASNQWEWLEFPAEGLSRALAPGEEWVLRLGVRRDAFALYTPTGTNGASYQSILELTDSAQSLMIRVPVSAVDSNPALLSSGLEAHDEKEGLWVGQAKLDQVNAPAYTTNNLISTPAPMSLRLIVHVDSTGQARLLQEVLLAWDPTLNEEPHTNGTYALYADEQAIPADASQIKRISSVGFPVMAPVPMTGGMTNELDATVAIGFGDPTNPFLHRYHPMHDNKDWDFVPYTNAVEVPNITRDIAMKFLSTTNETADPIWGGDTLAGTYTEGITGLRAQTIYMQGPFALQRISRINQLQGNEP